MTLIQRFGSAANLNVHLHMVVLDGVYRKTGSEGRPRFVPVPEPTPEELQVLVQAIAERIGRSLERAGLITRDIENAVFLLPHLVRLSLKTVYPPRRLVNRAFDRYGAPV